MCDILSIVFVWEGWILAKFFFLVFLWTEKNKIQDNTQPSEKNDKYEDLLYSKENILFQD